jgi:hypothetical protein
VADHTPAAKRQPQWRCGAQDLAPVVEDIRADGGTSLRVIAAELNAWGMLTRRGGRWHVSTVTNLLNRLGIREGQCASLA